jgi:repressor of nif and glnA expression
MEIATREIGFVTRHMAVLGTIITQMGLTMMESGETTDRMDGASSVGPMVVNTADNIT